MEYWHTLLPVDLFINSTIKKRRVFMIITNKSKLLGLSIMSILIVSKGYASCANDRNDNISPIIIKKSNTQIILEKPYRHQTTIAASGLVLTYGLHNLCRSNIARRLFGLPLIGAGLISLYKTEQATGKSTIKTITESIYNPTNGTKFNDCVDRSYETSVKQCDTAIEWTQNTIKKYSDKKD